MLKKISVNQLRLGMHLHGLCGAWLNHPFWRTKFVIKDPDDIRQIRDSGIQEVWIDSSKGLDVAKEPASCPAPAIPESNIPAHTVPAEPKSAPPESKSEPEARTPLADEVKRAAKICNTAKEAVVSMFEEARMGKAVSAEAAGGLVEEISTSVMRNPGALISLSRLKTADDYTYMHSVAVCALMVAVARQMSFSAADIKEAGMAGLLHDLGKATTPLEVLNKPGKLTDEEFGIIKQHPVEGHRMLVEGQGVGGIPLDVCLHHHEKIDGSGYPERLKGDQISIFAKIGAVCDVYDAITSHRPYKSGWDPAESIRKMSEWRNGHFDEFVFQAFVKSIGIYPVGSLVRLQSGRLGVVIEQTDKSLLTPKVKVFFSIKSNARIAVEILDLSSPVAKDKILSIEESSEWGFNDLNELWLSGDNQ